MFKPFHNPGIPLVSVAPGSRAVKASIALGAAHADIAAAPTGFVKPATLPKVPSPLAAPDCNNFSNASLCAGVPPAMFPAAAAPVRLFNPCPIYPALHFAPAPL